VLIVLAIELIAFAVGYGYGHSLGPLRFDGLIGC
jgi:hypothetical protein